MMIIAIAIVLITLGVLTLLYFVDDKTKLYSTQSTEYDPPQQIAQYALGPGAGWDNAIAAVNTYLNQSPQSVPPPPQSNNPLPPGAIVVPVNNIPANLVPVPYVNPFGVNAGLGVNMSNPPPPPIVGAVPQNINPLLRPSTGKPQTGRPQIGQPQTGRPQTGRPQQVQQGLPRPKPVALPVPKPVTVPAAPPKPVFGAPPRPLPVPGGGAARR